jgi:hypothetical protein
VESLRTRIHAPLLLSLSLRRAEERGADLDCVRKGVLFRAHTVTHTHILPTHASTQRKRVTNMSKAPLTFVSHETRNGVLKRSPLIQVAALPKLNYFCAQINSIFVHIHELWLEQSYVVHSATTLKNDGYFFLVAKKLMKTV